MRSGRIRSEFAHEVADLDLALCPRLLGGPRFHRRDVLLVELELLGVLDGDDALVVRDEAREDVEERRLTSAGTATHHDVEGRPFTHWLMKCANPGA